MLIARPNGQWSLHDLNGQRSQNDRMVSGHCMT